MKITIPHYFDFGEDRAIVGDDLVRPAAWDALRTRTSGPFALPATRLVWEQVAERSTEIAERARRVEAVIQSGVGSIASYGVGGATLEYWLQRLRPERRLLLGEYAPATVERLRTVFPEAETYQHDLLTDPPLPADWHLFHRIDTEFTNQQWHAITQRFSGRSILVVAAQILDLHGLLTELRRRGLRRRTTRAGILRNRAALESLWRHSHRATRVDIHDLQGWVLEPK